MKRSQLKSVCVVGAGVIGLSTAVNIIEHLPGVQVTVLADQWSPHTTGDVAVGFWRLHSMGDTPEELILQDGVFLGSTLHKGDWNTEPCESDCKKIWEGCCQLLPSIKDAKLIKVLVGLRPSRPCIRLEAEALDYEGYKKIVIHNYGHGGSGITLHWGCAIEATKLVRDCLEKAKL